MHFQGLGSCWQIDLQARECHQRGNESYADLAMACLPLWSRAFKGTRSRVNELGWESGGHPKGTGALMWGCIGEFPMVLGAVGTGQRCCKRGQGCPVTSDNLRGAGDGENESKNERK